MSGKVPPPTGGLPSKSRGKKSPSPSGPSKSPKPAGDKSPKKTSPNPAKKSPTPGKSPSSSPTPAAKAPSKGVKAPPGKPSAGKAAATKPAETKSPKKEHDKSPKRGDSPKKEHSKDKSPKKEHDKSPKKEHKDKDKSPHKDHGKSPKKEHDKSPKRGDSPKKEHSKDKSPKKEHDKSPKKEHKDKDKSPHKDHGKSPKKEHDKSPKRGDSPKKEHSKDKSPKKEHGKSPKRDKSPERDKAAKPDPKAVGKGAPVQKSPVQLPPPKAGTPGLPPKSPTKSPVPLKTPLKTPVKMLPKKVPGATPTPSATPVTAAAAPSTKSPPPEPELATEPPAQNEPEPVASGQDVPPLATPSKPPLEASPSSVLTPPPGVNTSLSGVSPINANMSAPSVGRPIPRIAPRKLAPKKPTGPLEIDPRSGLPLITIPKERQDAFAHLGTDILLHIFIDCDRISSKGKPLQRVMLVTDQTMLICEESGGVMRCFPVSKISQVNVATDNSNEIALLVPSEYDLILRFARKQQRDDLLVILRAVYKRMVDSELDVQMVKEIKPNQYRMEKPPGFLLQRIPQRTRAHLQKALEAIEQQEAERMEAIQSVQAQLDGEHKSEVLNKQRELATMQAKLDEANARVKQQTEELERLRGMYTKCKKRVEEIDGQVGVNGELPGNKDKKIRELQDVIETLSTSVSKAHEERMQAEAIRRAGAWEERDLDQIQLQTDEQRLRGRSLNQQGLIEVLQRQLEDKQRELSDLASKQIDLQKLNLELHKREETLRELEQTVPTHHPDDPSHLYSGAGGNFDELLNKFPTSSPPRGGEVYRASSPGGTRFADPMVLSTQRGMVVPEKDLHMGVDEDGEVLHKGMIPQQNKITLQHGLPEYRLPSDEREFTVDPRVGLPFTDIPVVDQDRFSSLVGMVLYFFGNGVKMNKRGREQARVIALTDTSVFQCNTSGHVNRCIWIVAIREVLQDQSGTIALLVEGKSEYDVLMRLAKPELAEDFSEKLKRVSSFLKRNPPLKVSHVQHINAAELKLEKPPSWEFQMHNVRSRKKLFAALQELGKTSAEERARVSNQVDRYTQDIIERIKDELRGEIELRREREFASLRHQLAQRDQTLREKQQEVRNLMRRISEHHCTVENINFNANQADTFETQGMYWIPSDPVVMECDLEILHVQFHGEHVVTSHANGFLNVWDISNAQLSRTLKTNGHTAKVTAFHFDGVDLISGGHDSTLRWWDWHRGAVLKVVGNAHNGAVTGVQFDAVRCISSGMDGALQMWDMKNNLKLVKTMRGHKSGILCFKFAKNVLASADWGWIFLWDIDKGIPTKALRDDHGGLTSIDLSGSVLISGGTSGVLTVWNLHTGEGESLEGHSDDITCVQLQQTFAVSSGTDCTVRMWNVKDMTSLGIFHNSFPQECRKFHFKANRFVVSEGRTIKVWTR